jgi:hypothetical protein
MRSQWSRAVLRTTAMAGSIMLTGCSLLTLESPVKPLPARELNARILTRDFARTFATAVASTADDIAAASGDPAIDAATLRWKINATAASRTAATQLAPMSALIDTWALTGQMRQFFVQGAGDHLFATAQPVVQGVAIDLDERMSAIVAAVTTAGEFTRYQDFVTRYVAHHPLEDLSFRREPVLGALARESGGEATLLASVGSVPEAMSDVADRLTLYGEQVPQSARWQVELALQEAGYAEADVREILAALDAHLTRISSLAETGPEALERTTKELRIALLETTARLDRSSRALMLALHDEREALAVNFAREREAVLAALDEQRGAMTADAERFAREWTQTVLDRGRSMFREAQVELAVLLALILGLPFLIGFISGRATARNGRKV